MIRDSSQRTKRICPTCDGTILGDRAQCPHCGKWSVTSVARASKEGTDLPGVVSLSKASAGTTTYIKTGFWDPCFGSTDDGGKMRILGIAQTSVSIMAGEPGAGKTTLCLALLAAIAASTKRTVLHISEEQAADEIKGTADRIDVGNTDLIKVVPLGVNIPLDELIAHYQPAAYVIDSISAYTNVAAEQEELCKAAKQMSVKYRAPGILISHITKDHDIAGAMALQHHVDTTMFFETDSERPEMRTLTTIKNRFGRADVSVAMKMTSKGLIPYDPEDDIEDEGDDS